MRLATCLLFALSPWPCAAQSPTPDDLLDRVEAHLRDTPREQALRDISEPEGEFVAGDLYAFCVDAKGVIVANGGFNSVIGKRADQFKLAQVGEIAKRTRAEMQGRDRGTVEYAWLNPKSGALETKHVQLRRIGSDICGAGVYQQP